MNIFFVVMNLSGSAKIFGFIDFSSRGSTNFPLMAIREAEVGLIKNAPAVFSPVRAKKFLLKVLTEIPFVGGV